MIPVALTIAGSDPSGGAGIQADLKTFHQMGVYGMSVITLVTVQNTREVEGVEVLRPRLVTSQLEAVLDDIPPAAAKTGALGSSGVIEALAVLAKKFRFPLVVDPVMISKHGALLLDRDAAMTLKRLLLPCAYLVTPNLQEAEVLVGKRLTTAGEIEDAARAIADMGAGAVLIKGGHREGGATDVLFDQHQIHRFYALRVKTKHTHGTGCTFSAAITALLAKGEELINSVTTAKKFITRAIREAPGLGHGQGPVNHYVKIK